METSHQLPNSAKHAQSCSSCGAPFFFQSLYLHWCVYLIWLITRNRPKHMLMSTGRQLELFKEVSNFILLRRNSIFWKIWNQRIRMKLNKKFHESSRKRWTCQLSHGSGNTSIDPESLTRKLRRVETPAKLAAMDCKRGSWRKTVKFTLILSTNLKTLKLPKIWLPNLSTLWDTQWSIWFTTCKISPKLKRINSIGANLRKLNNSSKKLQIKELATTIRRWMKCSLSCRASIKRSIKFKRTKKWLKKLLELNDLRNRIKGRMGENYEI